MRTWEQHYEYLVRHYDNGCVADPNGVRGLGSCISISERVRSRPEGRSGVVYDQAAARRLARGLKVVRGAGCIT